MLSSQNWALAKQIRQERLLRSWSQTQLAEMARVSLRTVQRLEKEGHCSHETLLAIASVFEIDVKSFTGTKFSQPVLIVQVLNNHLKRAGVAYVVLLGVILTIMATAFFDHYGIVDRNMVTENDSYLPVLKWCGGLVAIYIGVYSGFVGAQTKKWYGLAALGLGIILAVATFSVLPWIYFPFDQYSAGAAWLFNSLPWAVLIAVIVYFFNQLKASAN